MPKTSSAAAPCMLLVAYLVALFSFVAYLVALFSFVAYRILDVHVCEAPS